MHSRVRTALWIVGGVAALAVSGMLEAGGVALIASIPIITFLGLFVLFGSRRPLVSALISSLSLLVIARSTLAPAILTTTTPLWVAAFIFVGLVLDRQRFVRPRHLIPVLLLVMLLIVPTAIHSDLQTTGKAVGIGAMWLLVYTGVANLAASERLVVLRAVVVTAIVESVIAVLESLLKFSLVRDVIAANADDKYIVRPNVVLGDWTNRAQGTFGYPIPLAAFLVVAALVILFSGVFQRRALKYSSLALVGVAIALTGTRSSVVALAVGLAAYTLSIILAARKERRTVPGLKVLVVSALVLALGGVIFFVRSLLTGDFSLLHRSSVAEAALELFTLPPLQWLFGSGYDSTGTLIEAGYLQTDGHGAIDNALISQFVISGVVGLAILLLVIGLTVWRSEATGRAVLAALVAFFFFFDIFSWHAIACLFFAAVGFASTPTPSAHSADSESSEPDKNLLEKS